MPARFEVAENDVRACGVVVKIDDQTGRALSIERFQVPLEIRTGLDLRNGR
jgi:hypothetical protein